MKIPNLKFKFVWHVTSATFVFCLLFAGSLRAEIKVKSLSIDAEADKVVWSEEQGQLKVKSVGELKEGEVLPASCRVCVKEGEVIIEKDGKEIIVGPGEYFDPSEEAVKKGQTTYVKVAEGRVAFQDEIEHQGNRKSLGEPILVDAGYVLLKLDSCHSFQLLSIDEFDTATETAQAAAAASVVSAPPGEIAEDEGPPPAPQPQAPQTCNSPPC